MPTIHDPFDVRCPCGWEGFYPEALVRAIDGPDARFVPCIAFPRLYFLPGPYYCPHCQEKLKEE